MSEINEKKIEELANAVTKWLKDHNLWHDGIIMYYNDKKVKPNGKDCTVEEDYYASGVPSHAGIFSMIFEGPLHVIIGMGDDPKDLTSEFTNLFYEYGVYYELINTYTLTCYKL